MSVTLDLLLHVPTEGVSVVCTQESMVLEVPAAGVAGVKLDKWFAMPGCQFTQNPYSYTLHLPLDDTIPCGITRIRNTQTVSKLLLSLFDTMKIFLINFQGSCTCLDTRY